MNIQRLNTGKDGTLPTLKKDTEYLVVEVTTSLKVDVQSPAKMATGHRQVVVLEDFTPFPKEAEKKVSTKPQGE